MSTTVSPEFTRNLPKAELHVHIEGTLPPALRFKLAQRNHIDTGYSTIDEMKKMYNYNECATNSYDLAMDYLHRAVKITLLKN